VFECIAEKKVLGEMFFHALVPFPQAKKMSVWKKVFCGRGGGGGRAGNPVSRNEAGRRARGVLCGGKI